MSKPYYPEIYKFRVEFSRKHKFKKNKWKDGPDTVAYADEAGCQRWVDGVRKNCKEWTFDGEPVIVPNA